MRLFSETSSAVEKLLEKRADLIRQILELIPPLDPKQTVLLPAATVLFRDALSDGKLLFIREGIITYCYSGRKLIMYEPDDLVGFGNTLAMEHGTFETDFAVKVQEMNQSDFFKLVREKPALQEAFHQYLLLDVHLFTVLFAIESGGESILNPSFKTYPPGSIIIQQGEKEQEVYTLLDGEAGVYVDDIKVGDVLKDEIFGAIGALTETPRNATVKATTNCIAITLHKDRFLDLLSTRPHTVVKLIQDMARSMAALNEEVVKASGKRKDLV